MRIHPRFGTIIVVIIILVGISFITYTLYKVYKGNSDNKLELTQGAISLSKVVLDLKIGKDGRDGYIADNGDILSDGVVIELETYYSDLLSLDSNRFDLTGFYETRYTSDIDLSGVSSSFGADDHLYMDVEEPEETLQETVTVVDDPRIFSDGGRDYILVNDLVFSKGKDIVPYRGRYLVVYKEDVPETYKLMKGDPDNFYLYKSHRASLEGSTQFVDVLYESVLTKSISIVRVFVDNGKLRGFEVR